MACVPVLTIALVHWLFGVPISAFRPVLSDEVSYWHEALTFAYTGLRGGYYTLDAFLSFCTDDTGGTYQVEVSDVTTSGGTVTIYIDQY